MKKKLVAVFNKEKNFSQKFLSTILIDNIFNNLNIFIIRSAVKLRNNLYR